LALALTLTVIKGINRAEQETKYVDKEKVY